MTRIAVLVPFALSLAALSSAQEMKMSKADTAAGWRSLFDGKTTTGWRGYKKPGFPEKGWVVENGCLHYLPGSHDLGLVDRAPRFLQTLQLTLRPGIGALQAAL